MTVLSTMTELQTTDVTKIIHMHSLHRCYVFRIIMLFSQLLT